MRIVQLGARCNNACVFCAQASERERTLAEPSVDELMASVEASVVAGGAIAFVGGEPTLYDCLPDLILRARSAGAGRVVLQTNARRCSYSSYAQRLASSGVDVLDVSVLGASEAMHDYHTQTSGSYVQTLRGMVNGRRAGMGVVASVVVTRSNYRNLHEIVRVAKAAGARAVRFRAPHVSGGALGNRSRVVPHFELVAPYLRVATQVGARLGIPVVVGRTDPSQGDFVDFVADQVGPVGDQVPRGEEPLEATCRARPGRQERRDRSRRTGDDLREILPLLFEPTGEGC